MYTINFGLHKYSIGLCANNIGFYTFYFYTNTRSIGFYAHYIGFSTITFGSKTIFISLYALRVPPKKRALLPASQKLKGSYNSVSPVPEGLPCPAKRTFSLS